MKSLIVAIDKKNGMGKAGKLPWRFKEDFQWFQRFTADSVLVMGFNTFDEIAKKFKYPESGKFLEGRISYVVSRKPIPSSETVKTGFLSIASALKDIQAKYPDKHVVFIGGVGIFKEAMTMVDTVYLTKIDGDYECDIFFPQQEMIENRLLPYTGFPVRAVNMKTKEDTSLMFWIYKKVP